MNDRIKELPPMSTMLIFCALLIIGGGFYVYTYYRNYNSQVQTPNLDLSLTMTKRVVNPADQKYADIISNEADRAMLMIKTKNMNGLSSFVSAKDGLRFSPYANVKDTDQVFSQTQVANFFSDKSTYSWGSYDASGITINLTPSSYYDRFIYNVDYANIPDVSYNRIIGVSTTVNNEFQFYPGSIIVEYYSSGSDPAYQGMDWSSLRLVFKQEGTVWYLVGIIHDQWTT